jgi:integration host factor subunit alpha
MTKVDIVAKISSRTGMNKKETAAMLETFFTIIKKSLETGEGIRVSGFGSFTVNQKEARRGRNPHTGEATTIEAHKTLTFKPSSVLRDAINR